MSSISPESPRKKARIHLEPPPDAASPVVETRSGGGWAVLLVLLLAVVLGAFLLWPQEPRIVAPEPQVAEAEMVPPTEPVRAELETFEPPSPEPPPPTAPPPAVAAPAPSPPPVQDPFADAMTRGLAALERGDHAVARDAFKAALTVRPGASQAKDALLRAEAGLQARRIGELQRQAEAAEAEEAWREALKHHEAILALDASVGFAQEGQRRCRELAEISEEMAAHLARPERLGAEDVAAEASALVERASSLPGKMSRLRLRTAELARTIEAWSRPVEVWLESDNATEVVVYRVGRLGTFERRALELRPGTYIVVGSRSGYRDVRRQIVVEPGMAPASVEVRCDEAI